MLALDTGQGIGKSNGAGLIALTGGFRLPPAYGRIIDEHDNEGQAKQRGNDQRAGIVCVMKTIELGSQILVLIDRKNLRVGSAVNVGGYLRHDSVFPGFI